MPNIRTRLLETIRDAYPENFEGLNMVIGESVFGDEPHPNAVLNLFIQQNVTWALPMAYYMAARRGLDSLMDDRLSPSATLSGQTLRSATRGLTALREMELKETHRIVFTVKDATDGVGCSSVCCPLWARTVEVYRQAFDRITGSGVEGTRILQVLSEGAFARDTGSEFCLVCAEAMQAAHAEVRRKAWTALPVLFGLRA
jgi:hypothetical protein